jgi:hypothetical protein
VETWFCFSCGNLSTADPVWNVHVKFVTAVQCLCVISVLTGLHCDLCTTGLLRVPLRHLAEYTPAYCRMWQPAVHKCEGVCTMLVSMFSICATEADRRL